MLQDDDEEEDEDDYEQEHEHQWEKQEMADLAIRPLPLTERSFSLAFALWNYFVQLEDRQGHRDHDPTYNYLKKHDQERCDQRGESVEHCFDFFVQNPPFSRASCRSCQSLRPQKPCATSSVERSVFSIRDGEIIAFLHYPAEERRS